MRTIDFTSRFKKDYKRVQLGPLEKSLQTDLQAVLDLLLADAPLPIKNHDHAQRGEWKGFRDCHVRPDLVLIYRKYDPSILELSRLGSHSELFRK
jgi:mRNA interferase YafQ